MKTHRARRREPSMAADEAPVRAFQGVFRPSLRTRRRGLFLLLLSLAVLAAHAQEACPGTHAHLLAYAGTYQTQQLLAEPAVAAALAHLVGAELAHLHSNLSVTGSIDLIGCDLVIAGNADHAGGIEQGIVAVRLYDGKVAAAMLTEGRIDVYVEGADYFAVPLSIRDWLAVVSTELRYRFELPPNARQLPPQGSE